MPVQLGVAFGDELAQDRGDESQIQPRPAPTTGRGTHPSDVCPRAGSDEAGAFAGSRMR